MSAPQTSADQIRDLALSKGYRNVHVEVVVEFAAEDGQRLGTAWRVRIAPGVRLDTILRAPVERRSRVSLEDAAEKALGALNWRLD